LPSQSNPDGKTPESEDKRGAGWQSSLRDSASYLGIGSSLAFTVLLCLWLGHWLDKKFGTEPRYFLVGAVVGVVAAFLHFWKMYRAMSGGKK
jgi:F0F1-type ATP synthase assembly protein I